MIKKVFNFLFNFILSFLVFLLFCIILMSNTVFNKNYVKQKFKENNFYEKSFSDIKDDFENYTMQSGLELEILDNLITKDVVIRDIDKKLDAMYDGKKINLNTDFIRNELDNRINKVLKEKNRVPNESEKEAIENYKDAIVDSYNSGILYGKDLLIESQLIERAKVICIISIILINIILFFINKNILKQFAFIGINLIFSGILSICIKLLMEKRIQHILIFDSKFSNFLVNSLNEIIGKFYNTGTVLLIIGIILIILGCLQKLQKTIENKKD